MLILPPNLLSLLLNSKVFQTNYCSWTTLNVEATSSSQKYVRNYQSTRRHITFLRSSHGTSNFMFSLLIHFLPVFSLFHSFFTYVYLLLFVRFFLYFSCSIFIAVFRRVRKIAKSDYQFHVRLSAWNNSAPNLIFLTSSKICRENLNFIKIRQK